MGKISTTREERYLSAIAGLDAEMPEPRTPKEAILKTIAENVTSGGTGGADGKSAYELAQDEGYTGTLDEWLDSLKGSDGKDGADGAVPVKGVDYFTDEDIAEIVEKVKEMLL